uniref:Uncharacterized protein n=1 Tax=Romanomermis culicivorax TaxID=13658 RepID=A0A915LB51_ROMCU
MRVLCAQSATTSTHSLPPTTPFRLSCSCLCVGVDLLCLFSSPRPSRFVTAFNEVEI